MKKWKQSWKNHRGRWIVAILLLVFVVVIVAIQARGGAKSQESSIKTEAISRRNIVNSVSGTGKIAPVQSQELQGELVGSRVAAVYVGLGDRVSAGQLLARMDTSRLEETKKALQDQIKAAQDSQRQREAQIQEQAKSQAQVRQEQMRQLQTQLDAANQQWKQAQKTLQQLQEQDPENASIAQLQSLVDSYQALVTGLSQQHNQLASQEQNTVASLGQALQGSSLAGTMDSGISALEEQIKQLDEQIGKAQIKAGISGLITSVGIEQGKNYLGGSAFRIEDDSAFLVNATVAEANIADVAPQMEVRIKTDATGEEELTGYVTKVAQSAGSTGSDVSSALSNLPSLGSMNLRGLMGGTSTDASSGFAVTIAMSQGSDRLRLGMNANVSIITDSVSDALSVPFEAVQKGNDQSTFIEVLEEKQDKEGKKEFQRRKIPVTKGLEGNYYVQISGDGVTEGMQVVLPESKSNTSVDDLINSMGRGGGVN